MPVEFDHTELFPVGRRRPTDNNLIGKYRTAWVEDTFDADLNASAGSLIGRGVSHVGSSFNVQRARWFLYIIIFVLNLWVVRLLYLQIWQGEHFRALSENNSERLIPIPAERGLLYDQKGRQLTKNIPNFALAIVPQDLPKKDEEREPIILELAALTGRDPNAIRTTLSEYKDYKNDSIIIAEDVPYETALRVQIAHERMPGVYVQQGSKRLYLHTLADLGLASSTLAQSQSTSTVLSLAHSEGYVGKLSQSELDALYKKGYLPSDTIGKIGLEKAYETQLRGVYGRRRIEVNARGKEQSVLAEYAPQPGQHVVLSIDAAIQAKLEQSLQNQLTRYNKARGAAIAMDPRNGHIVAMVSLPAYDNNDFSGGITSSTYRGYTSNKDRPLLNRTISGTYPSGSTIKPAIAAAALAEGVVDSKTSILSNGGIRVGAWFFPDWQAGGHGSTNVARSLAWSVNTFYYYVGGGYNGFTGLGADKIMSWLKRLHFGEALGIEIPGELDGFVPSREWKKERTGEPWYIGDTYNLSIGQGDLLVTPLQIASLTSFMANWGTLYAPRLADAYIDAITGARAEIAPVVIQKNVVNNSVIDPIRMGMRECVVYGSCRQLSSLPINVAGKTGTAQWNANKPNHGWFTSFAPYENPEIVVTVLVEEGEEGSRTAVPVAAEFYRWWANYRTTGRP